MIHVLGVDIGSAATKAVAMDTEGRMIASVAVQSGTGTRGVAKAMETLYGSEALIRQDRVITVATGYGRMKYADADFQMSEITCHARGVHKLVPGARTIIDIGGQDSKAMEIDEHAAIAQFVMNDKCAAGTGRFLEVMARIMEMDISLLGAVDVQAEEIAAISNTCTVFAESEVISRLSEGEKIPNIVAGIHQSVAKRVAGLAMRVGILEKVVLTGGVAHNSGIIRALERELGVKLTIPEHPQITGALGAALLGLEQYRRKSMTAAV